MLPSLWVLIPIEVCFKAMLIYLYRHRSGERITWVEGRLIGGVIGFFILIVAVVVR